MVLDVTQLAIVGIVASVITQGLRLAANHLGWNPSLAQTNLGLFGVAIGLGAGFSGLPEFAGSDPAVIAQTIVAAATQVVGVAVLVYNVLLKKILRPVE